MLLDEDIKKELSEADMKYLETNHLVVYIDQTKTELIFHNCTIC